MPLNWLSVVTGVCTRNVTPPTRTSAALSVFPSRIPRKAAIIDLSPPTNVFAASYVDGRSQLPQHPLRHQSYAAMAGPRGYAPSQLLAAWLRYHSHALPV